MENLTELKELASDLSVLYVEDDSDIAKTIVAYLSKFFKEVLYTTNGQEGLELYRQSECDLVLTDINMPKMNGLEMIEEIKQINPKQNAIIISAYSDVDNFMTSIRLGVDGYIIKPINYNDMNNLLFKMVQKINNGKDKEKYLNRIDTLVESLLLKNNELNQYTAAVNKVAIVSKSDLKGQITFVNDFFCDVCGYSKEELVGSNHNIIRHPDVPPSLFKQLWETIQAGKTWEGDIKNRTKQGDPYYVHATIAPLFEKDGTTIREYIGIRFLTTSNEMDKREFKKKVMLNYKEFRQENYNYKKRIEELEIQLAELRNEDNQLKNSSTESKTKNQQLSSQITHYENEIRKIHAHHDKVLALNNENNKKLGESYKKALNTIKHQKNTVSHLEEDKALILKEIDYLKERLEKQRHHIADLQDTIKRLNENGSKAVKKGLMGKFL